MLLFGAAWPNNAPARTRTSIAAETEMNAIFRFVISSPQPFLRILGLIVLSDLEVKIARLQVLTLADSCNRLSSGDAISDRDGRRGKVAVEGENAVAVVENDQVSVSFEPLGKQNCSLENRLDR